MTEFEYKLTMSLIEGHRQRAGRLLAESKLKKNPVERSLMLDLAMDECEKAQQLANTLGGAKC